MSLGFSFLDRGVSLVGILNVTPDSFSDGGRFLDVENAVAHGLQLVEDGAHLIDVGGESTRPGATPVSVEEELSRVIPVIEQLAGAGVAISIDTRRATVAAAAMTAGARVVNDVSGLRDPDMVQVVANRAVPVVVMHAPSADMSETHRWRRDGDVVTEVAAFLRARVDVATAAGIAEVVIDPGIGFGKSAAENVQLLRRFADLTAIGQPILVGASRKRFLAALTGVTEPNRRDTATVVANLWAVQLGARALRVHDVAAHAEALAVWRALDPPRADPACVELN